jgi:hypothetical protein
MLTSLSLFPNFTYVCPIAIIDGRVSLGFPALRFPAITFHLFYDPQRISMPSP